MSKKKFVGRVRELERLNLLKNAKKSTFAVVRGRRRIGKSRLAEEASAYRLFIRFSGLAPGDGVSAEDQRKHFALQLAKQFKTHVPDSSDWFLLFSALASNLPKKPMVLLFDEISWMGQGDASFLPKIKELWDDELNKRNNILFVLCGSVSTWIDKNILSSTGFVGRINETISLEELSLDESLELLHFQGFRGSVSEKLLILSITGGVPWYIEQFGRSEDALSVIQRLCFEKEGLLTLEFKKIFNDLFGSRSENYLKIIHALISGAKEYTQIAEAANYPSSGALSEYIDDLEVSGFVKKAPSWNIKTGVFGNIQLYRLSDNYVRFYLKYIQPNLHQIEENHFRDQRLTKMPGFNTLMGLQFENLVLKNKHRLYQILGINPADIVADGPYFQRKTKTQQGCQIDLLVQTRLKTFYVVEIKYTSATLKKGVISEVAGKIDKLQKPRGSAFVPVLVYFGECSDQLADSDYFYRMISFEDLTNST